MNEILSEWELNHNKAHEEHWTVKWMNMLLQMDFALEIIHLKIFVRIQVCTMPVSKLSAEECHCPD